MADRVMACRGRRQGLLAGAAAVLGTLVMACAAAQAQPAGATPAAPAPPGGSAPAAPGPAALPGGAAGPGLVDPSRFWLPQLFPDLPGGAAPPGAPAQAWTLQPSIGVQLVATDNIRRSATDREPGLYAIISPQLLLAMQTARITGTVAYRPSLRLHFTDPDQTGLDHFLAAQATAVLVEDLLFLDVSGSGDARSVFGGFGGAGNEGFDARDRVQTTSYRISPYLVQRFGGIASARLGYAFRQSFQRGRPAFLPGEAQPFFVQQDLIAHEVYGSVSTGEDWGRLSMTARTSNTRFEGAGVYDGARRNVHTLDASYAVTREFAVTGDIGWQDERYTGIRPFSIQEPIWGVGARYTPSPDSFLGVRYGKRDGFESFSADGGMSVGVRTRLFVTYGEGLDGPLRRPGEFSWQAQQGLRVDAFGNLVDAATGVPVAIAFDNPLRATQSNIFRFRRATVALSQIWPRDAFTVALSRDEREPAAIAPGTTAFASESRYVSLSWSRELDPLSTLTTSGRFGVTEQRGRGEQTIFDFQAAFSRILSPSMVGTAQYLFTSGDAFGATRGRYVQNTIILGIRQFF